MTTTIILAVLAYLTGYAHAAPDGIRAERRHRREVQRLALELRDAKINRRTWQ